jgi:hypothetical protein
VFGWFPRPLWRQAWFNIELALIAVAGMAISIAGFHSWKRWDLRGSQTWRACVAAICLVSISLVVFDALFGWSEDMMRWGIRTALQFGVTGMAAVISALVWMPILRSGTSRTCPYRKIHPGRKSHQNECARRRSP